MVVILSSVGCGNKEADDNASTNNTTNTTQQQNATEDTAYVEQILSILWRLYDSFRNLWFL